MICKSTKAKRRQNAAFYKKVATITTSLIDSKDGYNFYVVSLPRTASFSTHLEARGSIERDQKYRKLLAECRK